jgi:hypothetical protein
MPRVEAQRRLRHLAPDAACADAVGARQAAHGQRAIRLTVARFTHKANVGRVEN